MIVSNYKRYMVFTALHYYPDGGLQDVVGSYDTLEEAETHLNSLDDEYNGSIFDRIEGIEHIYHLEAENERLTEKVGQVEPVFEIPELKNGLPKCSICLRDARTQACIICGATRP